MKPVGFIGVGLMGQPMALNLVKTGIPLLVWNRSPGKVVELLDAGANAANTPAEVFAECETVIMMLATPAAIDAVLMPAGDAFSTMVAGKLIINTGTASPAYSAHLAEAITRAGGRYVEAPVSGSKQQAQDRQLVAMVAGTPADVSDAREVLKQICRATFDCGAIPGGLTMKLAVNHFMIIMVSGLVEAFHFAEAAGLDPAALRDVLDETPMASNVSRVKAEKLASRDWTPQATAADVLKNIRLINDAASQAGAPSPLLHICLDLFDETVRAGQGGADMAAVASVFEARQRQESVHARG